jgi:hypothetical protein
MPAEGAMTRVTADWHQLVEPEPRVDAKVKELSEMTIGRTDDPENPFRVSAFEAAGLFGIGSRTSSGPAVMTPRQTGRTHDRNRSRPSEFSTKLLHPRGRSLIGSFPSIAFCLLGNRPNGIRVKQAEASWIADFDEPTRAIRQFFNCLSLCKMGVDGGPTNPLDA